MFVKVNYQTASKDGTTSDKPYITHIDNFIKDHQRILVKYAGVLTHWRLVHISPAVKHFEYTVKYCAGVYILFGKTEAVEVIPQQKVECEHKKDLYNACNFESDDITLLGKQCQCGNGEIMMYL